MRGRDELVRERERERERQREFDFRGVRGGPPPPRPIVIKGQEERQYDRPVVAPPRITVRPADSDNSVASSSSAGKFPRRPGNYTVTNLVSADILSSSNSGGARGMIGTPGESPLKNPFSDPEDVRPRRGAVGTGGERDAGQLYPVPRGGQLVRRRSYQDIGTDEHIPNPFTNPREIDREDDYGNRTAQAHSAFHQTLKKASSPQTGWKPDFVDSDSDMQLSPSPSMPLLATAPLNVPHKSRPSLPRVNAPPPLPEIKHISPLVVQDEYRSSPDEERIRDRDLERGTATLNARRPVDTRIQAL
jgi:hypothetical protein